MRPIRPTRVAAAVGGSGLRCALTVVGLAGGLVFAVLCAHLATSWR